jgi:hypothetical protein
MPVTVCVVLVWVVPDNLVLLGPWLTPDPEPALVNDLPVVSTPGWHVPQTALW